MYPWPQNSARGAAKARDRLVDVLGGAVGGCFRGCRELGLGRGELLAGGSQAAVGRAAQISIPTSSAGEIYRAGELKLPCTQEKRESSK